MSPLRNTDMFGIIITKQNKLFYWQSGSTFEKWYWDLD